MFRATLKMRNTAAPTASALAWHLQETEKRRNFALLLANWFFTFLLFIGVRWSNGLSYGVMVAQQFLVLLVQVRILVRQLLIFKVFKVLRDLKDFNHTNHLKNLSSWASW